MTLKFYTSVEKGLNLKVKRFCGLIPMFVELTGEKLVRGGGVCSPHPDRANHEFVNGFFTFLDRSFSDINCLTTQWYLECERKL